MRISDWSSDVCSSDLPCIAILTHPTAFLMTNKHSATLTYRDAGVDIDAGEALVDRIKPLAAKTMRAGVMAGIGGFGALFEVPRHLKEPVLVSGTDGVGTKLRLACDWKRHATVGIDLVAMSVKDIKTEERLVGEEGVSQCG